MIREVWLSAALECRRNKDFISKQGGHLNCFLLYLCGSCQVRGDPKRACDFLKKFINPSVNKEKVRVPFKVHFALQHPKLCAGM